MKFNESIAKKLIEEMKKPGRECMYDRCNLSYKNNHVKQNIWSAIAGAIGIERTECQAYWKTLRRRHKSALTRSIGKSGRKRVKVIKGFSKVLMTEMDFFRNFWEDKDPTVTNYTDSNTESIPRLLKEMACDPDVKFSEWPEDNSQSTFQSSTPSTSRQSKRRKIDDTQTEIKESLKSLNSLAKKVLGTPNEKRDPFFLAMEEEFSKVPDNLKSGVKLQLMTLIFQNQT